MTDENLSGTPTPVVSFKGFDGDLKCRGHQFAIGGTYTVDGEVKVCNRGFHACEYPLDVFRYYPPAGSRFAMVEQSDQLSRDSDGTKIASSTITIKDELCISGLVREAIEYTRIRCGKVEPTSQASATGDRGAASATGYMGKVMGASGCALFLVERDNHMRIVHAWAGIAGSGGIKPMTWYTLRDGLPVEADKGGLE